MDTVYIETSIVSYAVARPSQNTQIAALQQQVKDWWEFERPKFDLVTSQLTLIEASAGDPTAASDRQRLLTGLPLLAISKDAENLAAKILAGHMMPKKAVADASHVAVAALAKVNYLLTLNCTHIANAHELPRVYRLLENEGLGAYLDLHPIGVPRRKLSMKDPVIEELHQTRERLLEASGGTIASLVARLVREQVQSDRELRYPIGSKPTIKVDAQLTQEEEAKPVNR